MEHEEIPPGNLRCPPLGRSEVAIKGNKETPGELLGVISLSYSPLVLLKQRGHGKITIGCSTGTYTVPSPGRLSCD